MLINILQEAHFQYFITHHASFQKSLASIVGIWWTYQDHVNNKSRSHVTFTLWFLLSILSSNVRWKLKSLQSWSYRKGTMQYSAGTSFSTPHMSITEKPMEVYYLDEWIIITLHVAGFLYIQQYFNTSITVLTKQVWKLLIALFKVPNTGAFTVLLKLYIQACVALADTLKSSTC